MQAIDQVRHMTVQIQHLKSIQYLVKCPKSSMSLIQPPRVHTYLFGNCQFGSDCTALCFVWNNLSQTLASGNCFLELFTSEKWQEPNICIKSQVLFTSSLAGCQTAFKTLFMKVSLDQTHTNTVHVFYVNFDLARK